MTRTLYTLLLPPEKTSTQDFWNQHIAILRNAVEGVPYHLGTLSALLSERLIRFKEDTSRNNGLLLVQISATTWQLVRSLAGINGEERAWFKEQVSNPDSPEWGRLGVTPFLDQMHDIYQIVTFLRHPTAKLMDYDWVFHGTWPQEKAEFIIKAADTLNSIMNSAVNEFGLAAGWVGDTTKQSLHSAAMQQWAKTLAAEEEQS